MIIQKYMKKNITACIGVLLAIVLIMIAYVKCTEEEYPVQVLSAIKIMNSKPEIAIELLNSAEEEMSNCSEKKRMRYELLRIEAHDKNFDLQESDSLMKEIVAYYDRHGDRNDRMAAYYYMGSCYRDLGENPLALEWYFKAYQVADTASRHFDKNRYLAIYDQLTLVLADENNFKEELMWYKKVLNDFPEFMDDARTLHNIGEAYAHNNIIDTAAFFYNKSFDNMKKHDEWNKELFFGVNIQTAFLWQWGIGRMSKDGSLFLDMVYLRRILELITTIMPRTTIKMGMQTQRYIIIKMHLKEKI